MRDVVLAILAQVLTVGVNDRRGVVVDAGYLFLVDGNDDDHAVLLGDLLHEPDGWPIGHALDGLVPARLLLGAEVRRREDLLHAENLDALTGCVFNHAQVLFDVGALNLFDGRVGRRGVGGLYETAFNCSCHLGRILYLLKIYLTNYASASAASRTSGGGDSFMRTR